MPGSGKSPFSAWVDDLEVTNLGVDAVTEAVRAAGAAVADLQQIAQPIQSFGEGSGPGARGTGTGGGGSGRQSAGGGVLSSRGEGGGGGHGKGGAPPELVGLQDMARIQAQGFDELKRAIVGELRAIRLGDGGAGLRREGLI